MKNSKFDLRTLLRNGAGHVVLSGKFSQTDSSYTSLLRKN